MTLCPDCRHAEDDRLHAVYSGQLCCHARAIMSGLKREREATTVAVKRALNPAEWAIVRTRLLVLIEREKGEGKLGTDQTAGIAGGAR